MILHGNLRGGGKDLALHLLKDENDHIEIHEMRGFVADDLEGAFKEIDAVRRGTKAKKYLYSLSLNPPPDEQVPKEVFENAIERIEKNLGLDDQARSIVFHTKEARRHCHCIWSVIDTKKMKAISMSNDHYKLREMSRELYLEHGWKMPKGFIRGQSPDPRNFTHAEWAQAKRIGKHPNQIKTTIRDCWAASDTQASFEAALKEKGYFLALGRRGPVVMDTHCEIHSIARATGKKIKDIRARVDESTLRSTQARKVEIANQMEKRLTQLQAQQKQTIDQRRKLIAEKRMTLKRTHQDQQDKQRKAQEGRQIQETKARQDRYNKGLRGLLDRVTGKHKQIRLQNEKETDLARLRDQRERDGLVFKQLAEKHSLRKRVKRLKDFREVSVSKLDSDRAQFQNIRKGQRRKFILKEADGPLRKVNELTKER